MKYIVKRINSPYATESFVKEFKTKEGATKYLARQHYLLTEFEDLEAGSYNECMATYFYLQKLKVVLVIQTRSDYD